ncbi:WYL domain-containing protein [Actinoplanes sp. NBC_00393]|uniref:helix-turn-helix transcriptional regulator n=1 Tax=Actinoplanes sp. NBC_00393 TaxID=2975953 RepID=UPI002E2122DA
MATTSERILKLLSLLASRREWSGDELAARAGVSTRTIRRDIEALRELGYPVLTTKGPDGGYRLGAGTTLPPLMFDDDQAVAVALALQTAPATVFGLSDAAARALETIQQVMPARLRAEIDALRITRLRNWWEFAAPPIDAGALKAVGNAVRKGHLLLFDYLRPDGTRPEPRDADFVPPLRVEPHHLVLWAGRWYLVAYEPASGSWPIYRVDRIHAHTPTGRPFTRRDLPGGSVANHVMNSYDRGDTRPDWQCVGTARMDLPPEIVARWAPGGSVVEYVGPAQARITLGAWSWAGIAGILATFDADIDVIEPAELRDACRALARRLSKA